VLFDRPEAVEDVLPSDFRLEQVRRTGETTGRSEHVNGPLNGAIDLSGRGEGHRGLSADAAPEDQPVAKVIFHLRQIGALASDGIENRNANLDQIGM